MNVIKPGDERAPLYRDTHTWPPANSVRFRLSIADIDGDVAYQFAPSLPVEVTLVASEQPISAPGGEGRRLIVVPLAFPNFTTARVHAEGISHALGALERALERAQAAADTTIPTRDDGHPHVVRFERYSRKMPLVAMCEVCMEELVPDVQKWAHDRGLIVDRMTSLASIPSGTIKDAIENAVNRIGEEVDLG